MADVTLPKSFRHWCRLARLKPHGGLGRKQYEWYYLKGHGRVWRINCHGEFECGDTYAEFDRWALCTIEKMPLPQTKEAFLAAVTQLLVAHKEKNK